MKALEIPSGRERSRTPRALERLAGLPVDREHPLKVLALRRACARFPSPRTSKPLRQAGRSRTLRNIPCAPRMLIEGRLAQPEDSARPPVCSEESLRHFVSPRSAHRDPGRKQNTIGRLMTDTVDQIARDTSTPVRARDIIRALGAAYTPAQLRATSLASPAAPTLAAGSALHVGMVGEIRKPRSGVPLRDQLAHGFGSPFVRGCWPGRPSQGDEQREDRFWS